MPVDSINIGSSPVIPGITDNSRSSGSPAQVPLPQRPQTVLPISLPTPPDGNIIVNGYGFTGNSSVTFGTTGYTARGNGFNLTATSDISGQTTQTITGNIFDANGQQIILTTPDGVSIPATQMEIMTPGENGLCRIEKWVDYISRINSDSAVSFSMTGRVHYFDARIESGITSSTISQQHIIEHQIDRPPVDCDGEETGDPRIMQNQTSFCRARIEPSRITITYMLDQTWSGHSDWQGYPQNGNCGGNRTADPYGPIITDNSSTGRSGIFSFDPDIAVVQVVDYVKTGDGYSRSSYTRNIRLMPEVLRGTLPPTSEAIHLRSKNESIDKLRSILFKGDLDISSASIGFESTTKSRDLKDEFTWGFTHQQYNPDPLLHIWEHGQSLSQSQWSTYYNTPTFSGTYDNTY